MNVTAVTGQKLLHGQDIVFLGSQKEGRFPDPETSRNQTNKLQNIDDCNRRNSDREILPTTSAILTFKSRASALINKATQKCPRDADRHTSEPLSLPSACLSLHKRKIMPVFCIGKKVTERTSKAHVANSYIFNTI